MIVFTSKILLKICGYKNNFSKIANKDLQNSKKVTYPSNSKAEAIFE